MPPGPGQTASLRASQPACWLYRVESTREVKECVPHHALWPLQVHVSSVKQVDDSILHIDISLIHKLQWVQAVAHQGSEMLQDRPLKGFL